MPPHHFTLIVHDRIPTYEDLISPDTFRYTPERGWPWLQRLCFWILRRLDCRAVDKHVSYQTVTIDQSHLPETALQQIGRIKRRGGKPEFILMGPDEALTVQQLEAQLHYTAYYAESTRWSRQWYGIPVRVMPDFKGCVVIAEAYTAAKADSSWSAVV